MMQRPTFLKRAAERAARHAYTIIFALAYAAALATLYWRVIADGSI